MNIANEGRRENQTRERDAADKLCPCPEVGIDPGGGLAAFCNGPDDQRGAALGIPGGEDPLFAAHEIPVHRHVSASVVFHAQAVEQPVLDGTGKAHGQEHQIDAHLEFRSWNRAEFSSLKRDAMSVERAHPAVVA